MLAAGRQQIEIFENFGEQVHVRPINRHRHITAKSHEVPDIISAHVQRIRDDNARAAEGTKYCIVLQCIIRHAISRQKERRADINNRSAHQRHGLYMQILAHIPGNRARYTRY